MKRKYFFQLDEQEYAELLVLLTDEILDEDGEMKIANSEREQAQFDACRRILKALSESSFVVLPKDWLTPIKD